MAFFDFLKKKNKERDAESNNSFEVLEGTDHEAGGSEKKGQDAQKAINRRFFMLVEETFPSQNKDGIVTVGKIYGIIKNGDAAYLLEPGNQVARINVVGLAIQNDKEMEPVEEAMDQVVGVKLYDINGKKQISKYAVLTSIQPELDAKAKTGISNPYILGLAHGYRKFGREKEYLDVLMAALMESHLLAPVYMENKGNRDDAAEEGSAKTLFEDTVISFPGLNKQDESGKADFALFTDWVELSRWKNVFDENHPPKTMVFKFVDSVDMVTSQTSGHMAGIVINAFSENPIVMPAELIVQISKSEMYQKHRENQAADQ